MRSLLTVVITAAALTGCDPNLTTVEAETTANLGSPSTDGTQTCFGICLAGPRSLKDPWAGQRGYVVYHYMTRVCWPEESSDYVVIGYDSTMTTPLWSTEVTSLAEVAYYQNLPGTIPFQCIYTIDAGQVGGSNTNTGGDHGCCSNACFDNSEIDHLRTSCLCTPQTAAQACAAAGATCGTVGDGCHGYVACGSCRVGFTCDGGECVRKCTKTCAKGSYLDPDSCICIKGLPQ
jgi:hypothetical protein